METIGLLFYNLILTRHGVLSVKKKKKHPTKIPNLSPRVIIRGACTEINKKKLYNEI